MAPAREAPYFYDSLLRFMRHPFFQNLFQSRLWKFCVVGASSTFIDKGVFWLLMKAFPLSPWWELQSVSFVLGVTNGFFWNRHWTFQSDSHAPMKQQYPKFVLSNAIGLALNLLITKGFLMLFLGGAKPNPLLHRELILFSSLCAVPIVVIWNFTASRLWTFKTSQAVQEEALPIGEDGPPIASRH